jgi:tellurite resistance protein TerC
VVNRLLEDGRVALRKALVALLGGAVLLLGVVMLLLPGPAVLVIPLGLGILGLEFAWARRWLVAARALSERWVAALRRFGTPWLRRVRLLRPA